MKTMTGQLPDLIAAHIAAVNAFDLDAIMATFADDALVNDAQREFWGADAIRAWAEHELVGDKVTMAVTEIVTHHTLTIVRARYDGDYDKTNLPAELILTNYFTVADGKITSLITLHNRPVTAEQHAPRPV
ncbi:nuclear transport factor 2 family protein [Nocardia sp. NEAU-G5]|uniref:Nuclear transport factor 2 family protein n=1 Tax=Nocardia albiluteola TaxID=2842303 RepID=A0ABS6B224_9NOCA|nr:nuclear transport factor 2 family protein [Nocardia albiluteola]MBU3064352.1 nuclear transport factor 2 family protein [Nocardia albiluteola]